MPILSAKLSMAVIRTLQVFDMLQTNHLIQAFEYPLILDHNFYIAQLLQACFARIRASYGFWVLSDEDLYIISCHV